MPQLSVTTNAPQVAKNLENLAKEIPDIGRGRIYGFTQRVIKRMHKAGSRITYPVQWDSEKQRRAFFATNGFGGGIPTTRTGLYQASWIVNKIDDGYRIENKSPGAQFVGGNAYGQRQSRIHQLRWPLLRDVTDKEAEKLPVEVRDQIIMVARRKGFDANKG